MTGPDVLIMGKQWADDDPERARGFMGAYFEALERVAAHPGQAAEIVHGKYIQQDLAMIKMNMKNLSGTEPSSKPWL